LPVTVRGNLFPLCDGRSDPVIVDDCYLALA